MADPAIMSSVANRARNQPYFTEMAAEGSPGRSITPL